MSDKPFKMMDGKYNDHEMVIKSENFCPNVLNEKCIFLSILTANNEALDLKK